MLPVFPTHLSCANCRAEELLSRDPIGSAILVKACKGKAMFVVTDTMAWAQENFGGCELGDKRRSARLVRMAGDLARHAGSSLLKSCDGDEAAAEGLYRLLRNDAVNPAAIAEGGFAATVRRARSCEGLLAVEDSTSLVYRHSVAEELGTTSSNPKAVNKGFIVHSVVLLDSDSGATVGLLEQQRWKRAAEEFGKAAQRKRRAYANKESFKWQRAGQMLRARLGETLSARVIAVCDREADITEYLLWQREVGGRYVVRSAHDRNIAGAESSLRHTLEQSRWLGTHEIAIPQRGGRPARRAQVSLRAQEVELACPVRLGVKDSVRCHAVSVREDHAPADVEPLDWLLLTTEPVTTRAEVLEVLWIYSRRWRIEDFHKAWKSGANVEELRPRSADNLERGVVILAFVAIRLLQLQEMVCPPLPRPGQPVRELAAQPCDTILTTTEWCVLYIAISNTAPPSQPPSAAWAYRAIAKLGGWMNTQRTGRPGWQAIWYGMFRLAERVDAHVLALKLCKRSDQ